MIRLPRMRPPTGAVAEIRIAAAVMALQSLALLAGSALLAVQTVQGKADDVGRALTDTAAALGAAVILAALAMGLLRLRAVARTPVVVLELLALPTGYSLAFQSGRPLVGVPVVLSALAVICLLFTPAARVQLER